MSNIELWVIVQSEWAKKNVALKDILSLQKLTNTL